MVGDECGEAVLAMTCTTLHRARRPASRPTCHLLVRAAYHGNGALITKWIIGQKWFNDRQVFAWMMIATWHGKQDDEFRLRLEHVYPVILNETVRLGPLLTSAIGQRSDWEQMAAVRGVTLTSYHYLLKMDIRKAIINKPMAVAINVIYLVFGRNDLEALIKDALLRDDLPCFLHLRGDTESLLPTFAAQARFPRAITIYMGTIHSPMYLHQGREGFLRRNRVIFRRICMQRHALYEYYMS